LVVTRNRSFAVLFTCCVIAAALWPAEALAQRRAARPRTTRSVVFVARPYLPVFYSPFYAGWGWYPRWYGAYGYGPYGYPYPPYRHYYYERTGSARLQIAPRYAQVFIDGYFVGTVDEFDGVFQRLNVEAGEHELQVYLDGYRTYRQKVLFRPGATLKIAHALQPLAPGETSEPPPTPAASPGTQRPSGDRYAPPPRVARERGEYGAIAIRVQPADAEILIDGEPWRPSEAQDRLVVDLAEGPHRVEVRKEGFRSYTANVRIRRGETYTLNVSLKQEAPAAAASGGVREPRSGSAWGWGPTGIN
jgi:hypothetical protein